MNLKELLQDWEDQDISAYYLACCLGIIDYDKTFEAFKKSKHIFWTGNPISDLLYKMIKEMSELGMLEFDEDQCLYRWNSSFKKL